jgi:hypothetical protein
VGCDIHMWAEVKKNNKWKKVGKVFKNQYYRLGEQSKVDEDGYEWNPEFTDQPYQSRNYDLFAILANVRNGSGFAGCDTGDGFKPIAMPRGIPRDVSVEARIELEKYGVDGHSHSYFTLAELLDYDWEGQKTKHRGWVDPWNFEIWRKKGKPQTWSGGVEGNSINHVSNTQMARMIAEGNIQWIGPEPDEDSWKDREYTTELQRTMGNWPLPEGSVGAAIRDKQSYYTLVEWEESYANSAKKFLDSTIPKLKSLGKPENVRIVFFFDN